LDDSLRADIAAMKGGSRWNRDIVTVRNRRWRSDLTLSDVIRILHEHGYRYTTIHCAFCRSRSAMFTYFAPKV
jgi:hypothetical protein